MANAGRRSRSPGVSCEGQGIGEPAVVESVAAFFELEASFEDVRIRQVCGFDLIPASSALTKRMRVLNRPTDVLWIRETLAEAEPAYELVVFDTAAALTVYSLNALVASQHVVNPVLPEYQSVVGSEQTCEAIDLCAIS